MAQTNNSGIKSDTSNVEDDIKVVLTQTLCKVEQVFVYKIPPMKNASGHRAEDWDLAHPAATCSLQVVQRDNTLLIQLMGHRPKQFAQTKAGGTTTKPITTKHAPPPVMEEFLFAQAMVVSDPTSDKALRPIEYWVEAVVDSSRYFVIRCEDEKSKRQAHVGIGFRERDESLNFKMAMEDFWRSMERERKALHMGPPHSPSIDSTTGSESSVSSDNESTPLPGLSSLSLKEGEKIHINLKKQSSSRGRDRSGSDTGAKNKANLVGKGGLLLKKPPPPVGAPIAPPTPPTPTDKVIKNAELEAGTDGDNIKKIPVMPLEDSATATTAADDPDDDDWGDFEG